MTDTIWITRTQPSADESAKIWKAAGFEPIVLPLLDIVPIRHEPVSQDALVIFTSKNGVDHFSGSGQSVVCVGDATAARAKDAGYEDIVSVDGTSEDVTRWITHNMKPSQKIVHISGQHVRGSIVEDLSAAGYSASRLKVYKSVPVERFPEIRFSHVALYSPLAAQTFKAVSAERDVSAITAVSISEATSDELTGLHLKARLIATRPREDALVSAACSA